jgi:hypothetical protein
MLSHVTNYHPARLAARENFGDRLSFSRRVHQLAVKVLVEGQPEILRGLQAYEEITEGSVIADGVGEPCVFLAGLLRAEQVIAERLLCLATGRRRLCPGSSKGSACE